MIVDGRPFVYPRHVIGPDMEQHDLYAAFMPSRVSAFLDGYNVNIMAYGQTGSGKTHTCFGPPGLMAKAGSGALGLGVVDSYGLFPREASLPSSPRSKEGRRPSADVRRTP